MVVLDEIVETRIWRSGTEIVTHVNWSHVARVRRALGVSGDEYARSPFEQSPTPRPLTLPAAMSWPEPDGCAA
jgi:hypothetical protein